MSFPNVIAQTNYLLTFMHNRYYGQKISAQLLPLHRFPLQAAGICV